MATYNGEKYIFEQLDSIRKQTRPADEVIIADDGSKDSTVDIITKFIAKNNLSATWKLLQNPVNKGWQRNFMDLINMATGDIIFLSDQDDICHPKKIERMTEVMLQTPNATLLACSLDFEYERKPYMFEDILNMNCYPYGKNLVEQVDFTWIWPQCIRPGCCMCFKKSLVPIATKLWFETCPHDLLLWSIAVTQGQTYILNEKLHYFRRHIGNNSPDNSKNAKTRTISITRFATLANNVLSHKAELNLSPQIVKKITQNRDFFALRIKAIKTKNIFLLLYLLTKVHRYPKYIISWGADVISAFR